MDFVGSGGLRFVIQYRPAVIEKELLDSGAVSFQGTYFLLYPPVFRPYVSIPLAVS
jgi:hypothetical protein